MESTFDSGQMELIISCQLTDEATWKLVWPIIFDINGAVFLSSVAITQWRMEMKRGPYFLQCSITVPEEECKPVKTLFRQNHAGWQMISHIYHIKA